MTNNVYISFIKRFINITKNSHFHYHKNNIKHQSQCTISIQILHRKTQQMLSIQISVSHATVQKYKSVIQIYNYFTFNLMSPIPCCSLRVTSTSTYYVAPNVTNIVRLSIQTLTNYNYRTGYTNYNIFINSYASPPQPPRIIYSFNNIIHI